MHKIYYVPRICGGILLNTTYTLVCKSHEEYTPEKLLKYGLKIKIIATGKSPHTPFVRGTLMNFVIPTLIQ